MSGSSTSLSWLHRAMRERVAVDRQEGRAAVLDKRRFDGDQVQETTQTRRKKKSPEALLASLSAGHFEDLAMLEELKAGLAEGEVCPDDLFMYPVNDLVGLLTKETSENHKILAVQILANLSPLKEKNGLSLSRSAGPYLVTLLSCGAATLTEASCIALGNLALSGSRVVKVLLNQSAVESLLAALDSPVQNVQASVLYALYHILHSCSKLDMETLENIVKKCRHLLSVKSPSELHWVIFVLSCNPELHAMIGSEDLVHRVLDICTYEIFQKSDSRPLVKIVTPIVRLLANLCAGPTAERAGLYVLRYPDLQAILMALLGTNYVHLCKETLWLIANIVNNESVTIQEELVELDFMDRLEFHTGQAIQKLDPYFTNVIH